MEQIRMGVVGVGMMGQRHCRIYSNLRGVQLVGVCDAVPEAGLRVAKQHETIYYPTLDDLLAQVDAVSLVVPTPLHFDLAMRCLERGVHVLIEKPITETLEQAEKLNEAAQASDLIVQIGHIERFNAAYMELKNVLDDMHVLAINLRRLSAYEGSNTDVDVVLDLMIHDLDLVLNLVGEEPLSVNAYGLTAYSGAIDHAVAHLNFASGPLLTVTASRVTEQKIRSIEVTAMEAYLEADLLNKSILAHRRTIGEYLNNHKYRQESIVERIQVPTVEPLFAELQHFVNCILHHKTPMVTALDGLKALRLATTVRNIIHQNLIDTSAVMKVESTLPDTVEPALVLV